MQEIKLNSSGKKINPSVAVIVLTVFVLAVYGIVALFPTINRLKTNLADKKYMTEQITALDRVIADENYQQKTDELSEKNAEINEKQYINATTVYDDIGNGAAKCSVTVTNVTFADSYSDGTFMVYPFTLSASGNKADLLQYIRYFEASEIGSYSVNGVNLSSNALTLTLCLYTPS